MKGKADIANFALRAFLTKVGHRYDELRGLAPFKPLTGQWEEVLSFFHNCCAYCAKGLSRQSATKDHLIPLNKASLGLHAWGNVVPSCSECNRDKHQAAWRDYLGKISSGTEKAARIQRIEEFQAQYHYNPHINLGPIADNLYEDVGAVAMTLIDLRFKQADAVLGKMAGR